MIDMQLLPLGALCISMVARLSDLTGVDGR